MRYCAVWMVPVLLAFAVPDQARGGGTEASQEEIRFDDALRQMSGVPQLQAARQALDSKRTMNRKISTLTNNPQVGMQVGYRRELEVSGLETQINVQQSMSLGNYSQTRKRAAQAEENQLESELRAQRFWRELRAGRAWLRLWGTVQVLHAAEHEVELAQKLTERTMRAVSAGAMTQADLSEAESYQAEAELAHLTLEGEAFEQGLELANSIGRSSSVPLRPAGGLPVIELPALTDALRADLLRLAERLPGVVEQKNATLAETARHEELRAHRLGSLWLGAQFVREPSAPFSLVGTMGMQLPLFDRGEREQADSLSLIARRQGEAAEEVLKARSMVAQALHDVGHSEQIVLKLQQSALPATEQTLRLRERLLSLGDGTVLEVLIQRRAVFALRGRLGRAQADHAASRFFLSRLLHGVQLDGRSLSSADGGQK